MSLDSECLVSFWDSTHRNIFLKRAKKNSFLFEPCFNSFVLKFTAKTEQKINVKIKLLWLVVLQYLFNHLVNFKVIKKNDDV